MSLSTEREIGAAYENPEVAARYVAKRFESELQGLLHDRQLALVQREIDRPGCSSVLEIAPGPGRLTRDLRIGRALTCLEYNQAMIEEGRKYCDTCIRWVRGNAFALPFATAEFDMVYTFRFVRHFHRADRERLYSGIRRVLKPGGSFVLDAVNERVSGPLRRRCPENYPIYDQLYSSVELTQELNEAGFEVRQLTIVQRKFRWQSYSQVLLGPRANWLNRAIIRTLERFPARDGLEWIVICRRA